MARRYRWHRDDNSSLWGVVPLLSVLLALFLGSPWYTNRPIFYRWLWIGVGIFALCIGGIFAWEAGQRWMRQRRLKVILAALKRFGLEEQVVNFINRFGFEKKKGGWTYRDHSFDWERLKDFRKFLNEKGLTLSVNTWDDTLLLLKHYIQQKEERVTRESIEHWMSQRKFSGLSSSGFENLLYRLFEAMGYTVQRTGGTGDQGGDLVANKDGQARMLIQAKRYTGSPVGNSAVQEAVAAQKYYDCNGAMVVASSDFTKEAVELAKANSVILVGKERLSELLLEYLKESWS